MGEIDLYAMTAHHFPNPIAGVMAVLTIATFNADVWAPVLNGLLTLLVLVVQRSHKQDTGEVHAKVVKLESDVVTVAQIAANAAAAANDTARIAKDIGGALRSTNQQLRVGPAEPEA